MNASSDQPPNQPFQESELEEHFDHSSGRGGQNVNKVSTKVTLRHVPTGIAITVQDTRSQARNRTLARQRLAEALLFRKEREKKEAIARKELERFADFRRVLRGLFLAAGKGEQRSGSFAIEILNKRLLSCPLAFAHSWQRFKE